LKKTISLFLKEGQFAEEKMKVYIKAFNDEKFEVTIEEGITVQELKKSIEAACGTAFDAQRLIYAGKVLKDADSITTYGIKDGHTVHMVKGTSKPQAQPASNTAPSPSAQSQLQPAQANPQNPPNANNLPPFGQFSFGGANAPLFGDFPFNPNANANANFPGGQMPFGAIDPQIAIAMLSNPQIQQATEALLSDPQFLNTFATQVPQLQGLMTPEVQEMLRNPAFVHQLLNPQTLQGMLQMQNAFTQLQNVAQTNAQSQPQAAPAQNTQPQTTPTQSPATQSFQPQTQPQNPPQTDQPQQPLPPMNPFALFGNPMLFPYPTVPLNPQAQTSPTPATSTPSTTTPTTIPTTSTTTSTTPSAIPNANTTPTPTPVPNPLASNPFFALMGAVPFRPVVNQQPPEILYQMQLQQLQDMGFFDATSNLNALIASNGNINLAVERLLRQM